MITFINKTSFQEVMPAPRLRSRSLRRLYRKVPGNRTSLHFKRRKPKAAHCSKCSAVLKGIPRELPYQMRKKEKYQIMYYITMAKKR